MQKIYKESTPKGEKTLVMGMRAAAGKERH
jgi:hypothetical protein